MAEITRQDAYDTYDKILAKFNAWWTQLAEDTYNLAQDDKKGYVPVDTGDLQKSGYKVIRDTGFSIGYSAPYAGEVYNPAKYFVGYETEPYTTEVKPYIRKGKPVKGHSNTYKTIGQRPWQLKSGDWATVDVNEYRANRQGNEWIQRAWSVIYEGVHPRDRKILGLKKRVPVQFPQSRINWRQ